MQCLASMQYVSLQIAVQYYSTEQLACKELNLDKLESAKKNSVSLIMHFDELNTMQAKQAFVSTVLKT